MNLCNLSRHSGLDPESSGFNNLLDTGPGLHHAGACFKRRRYDGEGVNGTAVLTITNSKDMS